MDSRSYKDHFFKKAKIQGYRSRSAFKLIELNNKFKFLKNGIKLLDVGSFPGSWCQVAREKIKNGKILGIDKKEVKAIQGVKFVRGDFLDKKLKLIAVEYFKSNIDVILSDMAPNTTGNKSVDCIRTNELCLAILNFSKKILSKMALLYLNFLWEKILKKSELLQKNTLKKLIFLNPTPAETSPEKPIYIVRD